MFSSVFGRTRINHNKMAAAATATAVASLFGAYATANEDFHTTFAESSSLPASYWGWTRRISTRWEHLTPSRRQTIEDLAQQKYTNPAGDTINDKDTDSKHAPETFLGQCLERQLYKPKVPYPAWDYNWDGRMTEDTSMEGHIAGKANAVNNSKKTRHIILVRHGQYDEEPEEDSKQKLTPLGRQQAIKTGQRLAAMAKGSSKFTDKSLCGSLPMSTIRVSNLARAKETARLIAAEMRKADIDVKLERPDPTLNEAMPAPMIPMRPGAGCEDDIDENRERVEEAFQKYFYRGVDDVDSSNENDGLDEFEIVVCHGNMIRYFFCRALQIPPEAWLRMSIYNCSMTYLTIRPNGAVSARMLGDIGHLDYEESTYSSLFGFKW